MSPQAYVAPACSETKSNGALVRSCSHECAMATRAASRRWCNFKLRHAARMPSDVSSGTTMITAISKPFIMLKTLLGITRPLLGLDPRATSSAVLSEYPRDRRVR
eukprot:5043579-Pleurochrysis_carterae.AAC.1